MFITGTQKNSWLYYASKMYLMYSQKYGGMKLDQARKETGDLSSIH